MQIHLNLANEKHLKFVNFRKAFFVMNNGIGGADVSHAKCEISFARGKNLMDLLNVGLLLQLRLFACGDRVRDSVNLE